MKPYYSDDLVTLWHGDCLDIMAEMPEASVDTVLTDPPYSSGGRRENARSIRKSMTRRVEDDDWIRGDAMSTPGFVYLLRQCGVEWRRILRPGGHVLSFIDWRMSPNLGAALETADLRQHPTLVWDKAKIGMGAIFRNQHEFIVHMTAGTPMPPQRRDMPNVLRYPSVRDGDHPTEKPTALLQDLTLGRRTACRSGARPVRREWLDTDRREGDRTSRHWDRGRRTLLRSGSQASRPRHPVRRCRMTCRCTHAALSHRYWATTRTNQGECLSPQCSCTEFEEREG